MEILREFPEDYEKFCYIKDLLQYSDDFRMLGEKCYSCGRDNHSFFQCRLIHQVQDPYLVMKKNKMRSCEQERERFCRGRNGKLRFENQEVYDEAIDFVQNNELYIMEQDWVISDPSSDEMDEYEYENQELMKKIQTGFGDQRSDDVKRELIHLKVTQAESIESQSSQENSALPSRRDLREQSSDDSQNGKW